MTGRARALRTVAPGVLVATSRRYVTTTTVVVGADGTALVVDPSWDPDELAGLAPALRQRGLRCAGGLATHAHYDHVLWHPALGDVPRWASPGTVAAVTARRAEVLAPLADHLPGPLLDLAARLTPAPGGPRPADQVPVPLAPHPGAAALPGPYELPWSGRPVLLHEHDAHAPAHLAVEVVDAGVLLAGDLLSDVELPMPDDTAADLSAYLAGLDRLAPVVRRCRVLVPGHGTPTDRPVDRLDADRRYLDALLGGRPVDDPRLALPEMPELHRANLARAAATRRGQELGGFHS